MMTGPAISDCQGKSLSTSEFDDLLAKILEEISDLKPELFPPHILRKESISERYHCFRTFRKTSDTRAIEMDLKTTDIDIVNKWRQAGKKVFTTNEAVLCSNRTFNGTFQKIHQGNVNNN